MNVYDTSALIELLDETLKGEKIQSEFTDDIVNITSITVHELLAGAQNQKEIFVFQGIIHNCNVLSFDTDSANISSSIEKQLTKDGKKINDADLFISGICMQHGATLITCDNDFSRVKGLNVKLF